jgi:hypothetical protein
MAFFEYLLAFSCKRRHFCLSCHQKRVVEFGEWICEKVLKAVSHRHFIFSIPKILRKYFLYDRDLLSELSRCGWESVKAFFQEAMPEENVKPGTIIAIKSFGDFPGFNPDYAVGIVTRVEKPQRNAKLQRFCAEGILINMLRSKIVKSRLYLAGQGFSGRSRWLLHNLGLILTYTLWVQTAVSIEVGCSELHLILRQGIWKKSSVTRSLKCSFLKV